MKPGNPTSVGHFEQLTPRQKEATKLLASPCRHVNLVGGSRSGKTVAIMRAIVMRGIRAPSRHAVLRFHAAAIWPSIGLQTFPFVMKTFFPGVPYDVRLSDRCFIVHTANGKSEIWLGGLDEKVRVEKILGNEYVTLFFNECSEIPYSSVLVALSRLAQVVPGLRQRAYYDLNPLGQTHWTNMLFGQKVDPISKRPLKDPTEYTRMFLNPLDHAQHLDPKYLQSLENLPIRQRKRFLEGAYVDESASQLWSLSILEETRVLGDALPPMQRVVIAIDPSGAASETDIGHDPIGIVVVGRGVDGHAYVLGDYTLLAGPNEWGKEAVSAYHYHKADRIVAERNFGGAMVEFVIRTVDSSVPYKEVIASRGKAVRAEPVAALYHQKRVHHVGGSEKFRNLEDELLYFSNSGYTGENSPNRADALVWGVTELMLGENASGWVDYYKTRHERVVEREERKKFEAPGMRLQDTSSPDVIMIAPRPHASFFASASNGESARYTADEHGRIIAKQQHVASLEKTGCRREIMEVPTNDGTLPPPF